MLATIVWTRQRQWPSASRHIADARHFVIRCLRDEGLADLSDVAALVVSELATNAVTHARSWFELRVAQRDDRLVLEVHDGSDAPPVKDEGSGLATGGRGLHLVEALSRDWGVRRGQHGGKCVWATLDLHRDPES